VMVSLYLELWASKGSREDFFLLFVSEYMT
jgi:hypothetical protein